MSRIETEAFCFKWKTMKIVMIWGTTKKLNLSRIRKKIKINLISYVKIKTHKYDCMYIDYIIWYKHFFNHYDEHVFFAKY